MRFPSLYLSAIVFALLSFACALPMRVDPEHEYVYTVKFKESASSASNEEVNKAAKDCVKGFLKQIHDAPGREVTVSFGGEYSPDKLESVLYFEAVMTHYIDGKFPYVVDKGGWVMCQKDHQGKYHGSVSPMALLRTNQKYVAFCVFLVARCSLLLEISCRTCGEPPHGP
ncbi:hypothetical protein C8R41DRAFT_305402 [Lentinula lateritia]|uniref:Uncharacterized protein n=1 Tax=Lentinula lateritia TaxID=40482 RepID=A0ABQ8VHZ8_9AGAR|nr:hypothetical protein C8R41DRAFT_305402 [Lentinula lateritia]